MSQNKLAKLRNTDVFKALMRVLEDYRVPKEDYSVLDKRPHPMLTVRYCGVEREMSIPSTPKTRGKAPVAYSGHLRRLLKDMQMQSLGASLGQKNEPHRVSNMTTQAILPLFRTASAQQSSVVTMSSREIAELTGKRHPDVKRDIDKMLVDLEEDASKFAHIYLDSMNREQTEYRLDRDLTETLLLGYSAPLRLKVIRRLRELEAAVNAPRPLTTTETLIQMLQLQAESERRQAEVERRQTEQAAEISALNSEVSEIRQAHSILEKMPTDCEGIERIRKRINKEYGLSVPVVDKIMRDSPFAPTVRVLVRNPHAEGVHNSGFSIKEISAIFRRFVDECRHSSGNLHTHPYIEQRFVLKKAG